MAQSDAKVLVNEEDDKDDADEIVRTYGSTTELSPYKKTNSLSENSIVVKIEDIRKDGKIVDRLRLTDDVCNDAEHDHDIRSLHDFADACDHSLSKDSDSLIQDVHYSSVENDSSKCWWTHPKIRENWRTVLSAFVLFIIGSSLLIAGIVVEILPHVGLQGFVFLIAGGICFIPGAYHIVYIYCAVKGRRGYDFYHLPLFN